MTAVATLTGASATWKWESVNWTTVSKQVLRLQMRIAKAIREKRYGKAKALQWLLTHSFHAKLLAVKRVVQNKGGKTAGVDGVVWKSSKQKMEAVAKLRSRGCQPRPLRRIYIPKRNGKQRPLSIPCMIDRSHQALHLLGLEPVSETLADKNAYGFRPKRSCADAIEQCFKILARKGSSKFILEGDIRSCFDKIRHQWLEDHIPMDTRVLKSWLKAGFVEKNKLFPTLEGTPQGGVASPTLLTMTLRGLEDTVKRISLPDEKVHIVTYADDFVVTGASEEVLQDLVKPAIAVFLKERGLELSEEKTRITHIEDGFDFLGFNVRKYKGKLLIKPSQARVKDFLRSIRNLIKSNKARDVELLIRMLNPKIRGWANYYRHVVAKRTFSYVDCEIFKALWQWAKRRHPNQRIGWIKDKYFRSQGLRNWIFFSPYVRDGKSQILDLVHSTDVPIKRHVKIRGAAHPYDPAFHDYFVKRELNRRTGSGKTGLKKGLSRVTGNCQARFLGERVDR